MTNQIELTGGVSVKWSTRSEGNLGHLPPRASHDETCCGPQVVARRHAFHDQEWLYLAQVHGNEVVVAEDVKTYAAFPADAAVTTKADLPLAIATADCAPIALASPEGVLGAVHAGWRGLQCGVLTQAVERMRELGATDIHAALGPCIHVECYEFTGNALDDLAMQFGTDVIGRTSEGSRALDMVAAVRASCNASGVQLDFVHEDCTAHTGKYFSYRKNQDEGRQVMVVWK